MGWREVVITAAQVIVGGPSTAGTGVFVYDPTIATGNLIASVTDSATSPTGDTTQKGITSYNNITGAFARLFGGSVNLQDAAGNPWTVSAVTNSGIPYLEITSNLVGGGTLAIDQNGMLLAGPSSTGPLQGWHLATLAGSWANIAGEALEYKIYPDNTVGIHGQLTIPAGVTGPANSITTALPSAYRPANRLEPVTLNENLAASPFTSTPHLGAVTTGGVLEVFGAATNGNTLSVQIRYPLDGT